MSIPSAQCRLVAKYEQKIFGGKPLVREYLDEAGAASIDMLTCLDPVDPEIVSIGTIGVSEVALITGSDDELFTRVELCAAVLASEGYWVNAVASVALHIMKTKRSVLPGCVVENILRDYIPNPRMPHVYLAVPFFWNEDHFPQLDIPPLQVNWLQCISIYEEERLFIQEFGSDAFEARLVDQNVNILDMSRQQAVLD